VDRVKLKVLLLLRVPLIFLVIYMCKICVCEWFNSRGQVVFDFAGYVCIVPESCSKHDTSVLYICTVCIYSLLYIYCFFFWYFLIYNSPSVGQHVIIIMFVLLGV